MLPEPPSEGWQLKKLTEKHKEVAALLAQGTSRLLVAAATDFTPEYITMLQRQPLFIAYLQAMTEAAQVQLEAMFCQSVETIGETLRNGTEDGKLKAAKLQGELTGRLGSHENQEKKPSGDRLPELAERLVSLLQSQRKRVFENGEVSEAQILG